MTYDNDPNPWQRIERSSAEHQLIRALFGKQDDEDDPPPAWLNIRLAAPLGDDALIEIEQDDG